MTLMLPYHYGKAAFMGGTAGADVPVDVISDNLALTLHTATYTPNRLTHRWASDLSAELASGNGYTTGGVLLASKTVSAPDGSGNVFVDAADVVFNFTANKTFRYAVLKKDSGVAGTSPLLWLVDFEADQTIGVTFQIAWNASGLWQLT